MNDLIRIVAALVTYRVVTIGAGLVIAYWGYKLFVLGVYEKAGELKAAWGDRHLTLKQAAPGTFFALFGAVVISIGLVRGINLDHIRQLANKAEEASPSQEVIPASETDGGSAPSRSKTVGKDGKKILQFRVSPKELKSLGSNPIIFGSQDPEMRDIVEKSSQRPLTHDEYLKLKQYIGFMEMIHIEVRAPDNPADETIKKSG